MDFQHSEAPEGGAVSIAGDKNPGNRNSGALRAVWVLTDTHWDGPVPICAAHNHSLMLGVGSGFILLPLISLLLLLIEFWRGPRLS